MYGAVAPVFAYFLEFLPALVGQHTGVDLSRGRFPGYPLPGQFRVKRYGVAVGGIVAHDHFIGPDIDRHVVQYVRQGLCAAQGYGLALGLFVGLGHQLRTFHVERPDKARPGCPGISAQRFQCHLLRLDRRLYHQIDCSCCHY